jgi:hypothetical protein
MITKLILEKLIRTFFFRVMFIFERKDIYDVVDVDW